MGTIARKRFIMIIKNTGHQSQFVYEFYTDTQYATSFLFDLPSMGIWIAHGHPWLVIMRECQRTLTNNWSDLNAILSFLVNFYNENTNYPNKETLMSFLKEYFEGEELAIPQWFNYPEGMDYK
jgi:hypothetical protein